MKNAIVVAILLASTRVSAGYELGDYISASRNNAPANRSALLLAKKAEAEKDVNFYKLFPQVSLSGDYLYNQWETSTVILVEGVPRYLSVTPKWQYDAAVRVTIPIFDFEAIQRYRAARATNKEMEYTAKVNVQKTDALVVRAFFQYVAGSQLYDTAQEQVAAAENLVKSVDKGEKGGVVDKAELERAYIGLDRAKVAFEEISNFRNSARRALMGMTRIDPAMSGAVASLSNATVEEGRVEDWLVEVEHLAAILASENGARAARVSASRYMPKLSVVGIDRYTNAYGFQGHPTSYQVGALLTWDFDFGFVAAIKASNASVTAAEALAEQTRQEAYESIISAFEQVKIAAAKCRIARRQAKLADQNLALVNSKYASGTAPLRDAVQARQDAYTAQLERAQAEAEYFNARALLRLAAGRDLRGEKL